MISTYKALTAEQGSTFRLSIEYRDKNGALVNLTGYIANMGSKAFTALPGTVTPEGLIIFKATDEVTALWPGGKSKYWIDVINPTGDSDRIYAGPINIKANGA